MENRISAVKTEAVGEYDVEWWPCGPVGVTTYTVSVCVCVVNTVTVAVRCGLNPIQ